MQFIKFIISPDILIILIGGLVTLVFGYLSSNKEEKPLPKSIARGTFIGGILVIIGGILSGYSDFQQSNLLNIRTEQIYNLSQDNAKLSRQNASLSEQNKELNTYTINSITGGESYCYYKIACPGIVGSDNNFSRWLTHVGTFPIYDLSIRIFDSSKCSKATENDRFSFEELLRCQEYYHNASFFKLGNANFFQNMPEMVKLPKEGDKISYSVFFTARNGEWLERVVFRKIQNKWLCAFQVKRLDKVLIEKIPPDFPKEKDGQVLW
jgi:hypothetical protein